MNFAAFSSLRFNRLFDMDKESLALRCNACGRAYAMRRIADALDYADFRSLERYARGES